MRGAGSFGRVVPGSVDCRWERASSAAQRAKSLLSRGWVGSVWCTCFPAIWNLGSASKVPDGPGSGHGLLQLGAAEVGQRLPPVFLWWGAFAAVT